MPLSLVTDAGDPRPTTPPVGSGTDEPQTLIHGATRALSEGLDEIPTRSTSLTSLEGEVEARDKQTTNPSREPFNEQSERSDTLLPEPSALTEAGVERATTPPRLYDTAPSANDRSSLKSTPSNRGTAALSHVVEETRVRDLEHYFAKDLQSAKECTVEKMLLCLFSRVCRKKTKKSGIYDMYRRVRSEVLDICNAKVSDEIREHMRNYAAAESEIAMYDPFVELANQTLDIFHTHSFDGLRDSADGDDRVIFQVNDPRRISATYTRSDGLRIPDTLRVPDVLLLKFGVARDARPPEESCETWDEHMVNGASAPIRNSVKWEKTLCAGEFKFHAPSLKNALPLSWQDSETPELVPAGVLPNPDATLTPSAPASVEPQRLSTPEIRTRSGRVSNPVYPSGSQGAKRKSDSSHGSSNKRPKHPASRTHVGGVSKDRRLDGAVQTAIYASERLCSRIQISHCINFLVHGGVLRIWYFDHDRCLRTTGLRIIEDYPFFALLLVILQRFQDADWGYHPVLDADSDDHISVTLRGPEGQPVVCKIPANASLPLQLHGRCSVVVEAESSARNPFDQTRSLSTERLVAKVYRPDRERSSEVELLKLAYSIAEDAGDIHDPVDNPPPGNVVKGHIPVLIACATFNEPFTETFDEFLDDDQGTVRRLQILLFPQLRQITGLSGREYGKSLLHCFNCHYALWNGALHHRDISTGNLMYYELLGRKLGVLNDFDLAVNAAVDRTFMRERTGTWPFMAIRLIESSDGQVKHIYAFDAESFFWVLVWTAHRYEGGVLTRPLALKSFATLTGDASAAAKSQFLRSVADLQLTPSHQGNLDTVTDLKTMFYGLVGPLAQQLYGEITDEKVFKLMHNRLSPQFSDDLNRWLAEQCEKSPAERSRHDAQCRTSIKSEMWRKFPKEPSEGGKTSTIQQQSFLDCEMWAKLISPNAFEPPESASS